MDPKKVMQRLVEQINARIAIRNDYADELATLREAEAPDVDKVDQVRGKQAAIDAELLTLQNQREVLVKEIEDDERVARLQAITSPTAAPSNERAYVGGEKRTYNPQEDPNGFGFFTDVSRAFLGNWDSRERLTRHEREERVERGESVTRAVTAGGSPGTVIPQYLVDLYAPKGRPGRKFADQCRPHPLPDTGMTVYIPRQTAITSVGLQVAELDAAAETDYDDELISIAVRTASGSQTISRQFVERGLGGEDIVVGDLLRSYDVNLDNQLLNAAVWGLLAVATTNTYTDATPTGQELYSKILGATAGVEDLLLDLDEDDLFTLMRGRRWAWMQNQFTSTWPLIGQPGIDPRTVGTSDASPYSAGVRGHLPNGGDVVTDNNLPINLGVGTNEDVAVVVARQEAHLWEDPKAPLFIRAEQTQAKKLGIDLVVYGYFAACFDRVAGVHQKITGTGLVPAVF